MNGLKLIRTMCNYSQTALAEKLGVTRQAINMWENSRKPIPESRRTELCVLFGIPVSEWLDDVDEDTFNEIRSLPMYKRFDSDAEHFSFSATDHKHGSIPLYMKQDNLISLDERCELKRLAFKKLLAEIQAFAEDTERGAMDAVFKQDIHLKMIYLYAVFAALDGVNIALDIVSEEDYLNSADSGDEIYDTRELAIEISKLIDSYLDRASSMIEERIRPKNSTSES